MLNKQLDDLSKTVLGTCVCMSVYKWQCVCVIKNMMGVTVRPNGGGVCTSVLVSIILTDRQ